jgi:hypothetical protein
MAAILADGHVPEADPAGAPTAANCERKGYRNSVGRGGSVLIKLLLAM